MDLNLPYWQQLTTNLNLIPFRSITVYLYLLIRQSTPSLLPYAWINFLGNLLLFIPFGFLLPCLSRRNRHFGRLLLTGLFLLTALEITQLFTLRGSFDVDDLLLNTIGVMIGYFVFIVAKGVWYSYNGENWK
jgi:glycopeptide antibiotics resistance protein